MQRSKQLCKLLLNLSFIFLISCLSAHLYFSDSGFPWPDSSPVSDDYGITDSDIGCKGIQKSENKQEKCSYVKSHEGCKPMGYIPYLQLFYCTFTPVLGYISLSLWLVLLFYLLADTASNYFCCSLAGLSKTMKLSPTLAGVSLLSLGNGAPDVFTSIISFTDDNTTDIGLNSILGGAFFVSCFVVGIISISVSNCGRKTSKPSFIKNIVFLLLSLSCLVLIIILGEISIWGAFSFLSLYLVYVFFIFTCETCSKEDRISDGLESPFLCSTDQEWPNLSDQVEHHNGRFTISADKFLSILELPLNLPRMLTIPVVYEERWSKPLAVISLTLAPVGLALVWSSNSTRSELLTYVIGGSVGILSGILAFCTTERFNPPRNCSCLWLAMGFIMSITWTYILAQELISLLVSLGLILQINHSIIGLTVLAWGNSVGDLVANVTMAKKGGPQGGEVAISGSYAGPIFNTVVGLGLSLTFSAWRSYPDAYVITVDHSVFITIGFFVVALVWALVVRMMRSDKCLGSGLLVVYLIFLCLQMARSFGL